MGKRAVTYSAVGGVLRVWNPTPADVKVMVGEKQAIVSPGCMKEFALPDAAGFDIEGVAGQGQALAREVQDTPPAPELPVGTNLLGSTVQPAVFDDLIIHTGWDPLVLSLDAVIRPATEGEIPIGYRAVQVGDVVQAAYELSGLSINEWNDNAQERREDLIAETLELLRAEVHVPSAGVHHELNLADGADTKDVMGIPPAPKQQLEVLPDGRIRGRRVRDTDRFAPGDYGRHPVSAEWMAHAPGGGLGSLSDHEVVEHEDGTITVSPSIAIDDGRSKWHGYLEAGIWRKA